MSENNLMTNRAALLRYEWTSGSEDRDNAFRAGYASALTDIGEQARPGAPITLTIQFADIADAEKFELTAVKVTPLDVSMSAWEQWQSFVAALRSTIDTATSPRVDI